MGSIFVWLLVFDEPQARYPNLKAVWDGKVLTEIFYLIGDAYPANSNEDQ
jgi:hypothetical protein